MLETLKVKLKDLYKWQDREPTNNMQFVCKIIGKRIHSEVIWHERSYEAK